MGMGIPVITSGILRDHRVPKNEHLPGRSHARNRESTYNEDEIKRSLEILQQTFYIFNRKLKFSINREINRIVVKVIDGTTDKVIKEIPPDEIQRLVARIKETIGLLFDEKI